MKIKIQFWKTPKKLYCCLLENKNTLFVVDILVDDARTGVLLNGPRIVIGKNIFDTDFIHTECSDEQRHLINLYVNEITRIFNNIASQEIKTGNTVYSISGNSKYTVLHILPKKYKHRYVIADDHDTVYTVAEDAIKPQFTFTKEITDDIETYTWEV